MMQDHLLKPGSIVSPRGDTDYLRIWKSYRCDIEDDIDIVRSGEIMIILRSRKTTKKSALSGGTLIDEWKTGAYQVLSPSGKKGWVGAGWATEIA